MDNIEQLLERYFEGRTSTEEERTLRRFFTSGDVPENLKMYQPLFAYFENEIRTAKTNPADSIGQPVSGKDESLSTGTATPHIRPPETFCSGEEKEVESFGKRKSLIGLLSGVAACAAILIGTYFFSPRPPGCPGTGNYVIIDGQCYTDMETVRSAALESLQEMSDNQSETISGKTPGNATDLIEDQLKEFNSLFNEE